jgi:hypothetical protein
MFARPRVNALRNGAVAGGHVVLLPPSDDAEGWPAFLAAVSRKLGGDPIARLFNVVGFEIDALEEIAAGETLVCSSGEDFARPATSDNVVKAHCRAPTMEPPPLKHTSAPAALDTAGAPSPEPPAPLKHQSAPPIEAHRSEAETPAPFAHLTVLQAAPLTLKQADGRLHALPQLDVAAERAQLLEALHSSSRAISVVFAPATTDAMRIAITRGTQVLH